MFILQELLGYCFIGVIGMCCLAFFYMPVYFLLRKRVSIFRQAAYFLLTVCILVISWATILDWIIICLLDGIEIFDLGHSLNLIPFRFITDTWKMGEQRQMIQAVANIIMFVPLGFICPVALKNMRKFWKNTLGMALFSFVIEFIQYFIGRTADIDDLLLNTFGGIIGFGIFYIFSYFLRKNNI